MTNRKTFKLFNIYLQVFFYLAAGLNHFINPAAYISIIPSWLPNPTLLNQLSGLAEIIVAILFAIPRTRWWGAWGIVWVLIAVFPANIHMALYGIPEGFPIQAEPWALLVRLPIQFVLMAWAFWLRNEK